MVQSKKIYYKIQLCTYISKGNCDLDSNLRTLTGRRRWIHWAIVATLFKNGPILAPFCLFSSFQQTNITYFTTNQCEKCPYSMQYRDSNPQPFKHEFPPIATRLPPYGGHPPNWNFLSLIKFSPFEDFPSPAQFPFNYQFPASFLYPDALSSSWLSGLMWLTAAQQQKWKFVGDEKFFTFQRKNERKWNNFQIFRSTKRVKFGSWNWRLFLSFETFLKKGRKEII